MKCIHKFVAILLAVCLVFSISAPVHAVANVTNSTENVTYLPDGSYVYRIDDDVYFYDISTDETLVAVERTPTNIFARVAHVPADLTPYWIWYRTDGPYEVNINMAAINRILQTTGSWMEVSLLTGLAVGFLQIVWEAANGNLAYAYTYWEIDDGYHALYDPIDFYILSYFYSDANCTDLVYTDSFSYHG